MLQHQNQISNKHSILPFVVRKISRCVNSSTRGSTSLPTQKQNCTFFPPGNHGLRFGDVHLQNFTLSYERLQRKWRRELDITGPDQVHSFPSLRNSVHKHCEQNHFLTESSSHLKLLHLTTGNVDQTLTLTV